MDEMNGQDAKTCMRWRMMVMAGTELREVEEWEEGSQDGCTGRDSDTTSSAYSDLKRE